MNNTPSNESNFSLIIDEIDGILSDEGKRELSTWRNSSPENEKIYREFHSLNSRLGMVAAQEELGPDKFGQTLEDIEQVPSRLFHSPNPGLSNWLPAAAILTVFLSIGLYLVYNLLPVTISTAANERRTIDLPDGSSVTLNENTTVRYSTHAYINSRKLNLIKGEAFFNIIHSPKNEFVVELGDLKAIDLGTSFNIIRTESEISVVVSSGKVALENAGKKERIVLTPGKKGTYLERRATLTKTVNQNINYRAWHDKKLTFINTPLPEVATSIGKVYGQKILLTDSSLKERTLNASLNYQTADSALYVVSESLRLKVRKKGHVFLLGY